MAFRKIGYAILLLLCTLAVQAETAKIRVMSFNVSKDNIPSEGVNLWEYRVAALQNFWNGLQPDLMCFQEPQKQDHIDYLVGMPNYTMIGRGRNTGAESGEYGTIFYNIRHLLLEDYGHYWLSLTPSIPSRSFGSSMNRMCTWGRFRDLRTGAHFFAFNTHLHHTSDDTIRDNQMRVLKEQMQIITKKYPTLPIFLTGDFNTQSTTECYKIATTKTEPQMLDSWFVADRTKGSGATTLTSTKRIDYVLFTSQVHASLSVTGNSVMANGLKYSDHNPVYADLDWEIPAEDAARGALDLAQDALLMTQEGKSYGVKLITNAATQCKADAVELTEGQYYSYLTDENNDTYLHSRYSTLPPNGLHWLQVDLKEHPVQNFHFTFQRRNNAKTGNYDRWTDILVSASNDGETWKNITSLYQFGGEELKHYASPTICMPEKYRYVRFTILRTPAMRIYNSGPIFTCSEFQLYEDSAYIPERYLQNEHLIALQPRVEALRAAVDSALQTGTPDEELTAALYATTRLFRSALNDDDLCTAQQALTDSAAALLTQCYRGTGLPTKALLQAGNPCPLSCNAPSAKYGTDISLLLDGNVSTGFQSDEQNKDSVPWHCLQVCMPEPVDRFAFSMNRFKNGSVANCLPQSFDIYMSNDGTNWRFLSSLDCKADAKTYEQWTSPNFVLPQPFKYLRFIVTSNNAKKENKLYVTMFNLGEFNVWEANPEGSPYACSEEVKTAADALATLTRSAETTLATRPLTLSEVAALQQATEALRTALNGYITKVDDDDDSSLTSNLSPLTFNLSGQRITHLQKGINIVGGKKVIL